MHSCQQDTQWSKRIVDWVEGTTAYLSIVFTWHLPQAYSRCSWYRQLGYRVIVGGPPCQIFSQLKYLNPMAGEKHGNLIPEFERIVSEAQPRWWLMENVPNAPIAQATGYKVDSISYNNRWCGGVQNRKRRFCFGTKEGWKLCPEEVIFETPESSVACLARHGPTPRGRRRAVVMLASSGGPLHPGNYNRPPLPVMCELQGLPSNFCDEMPFTMHGKRQVIGNGVPMPMGRAVAKAVRKAI